LYNKAVRWAWEKIVIFNSRDAANFTVIEPKFFVSDVVTDDESELEPTKFENLVL